MKVTSDISSLFYNGSFCQNTSSPVIMRLWWWFYHCYWWHIHDFPSKIHQAVYTFLTNFHNYGGFGIIDINHNKYINTHKANNYSVEKNESLSSCQVAYLIFLHPEYLWICRVQYQDKEYHFLRDLKAV